MPTGYCQRRKDSSIETNDIERRNTQFSSGSPSTLVYSKQKRAFSAYRLQNGYFGLLVNQLVLNLLSFTSQTIMGTKCVSMNNKQTELYLKVFIITSWLSH